MGRPCGGGNLSLGNSICSFSINHKFIPHKEFITNKNGFDIYLTDARLSLEDYIKYGKIINLGLDAISYPRRLGIISQSPYNNTSDTESVYRWGKLLYNGDGVDVTMNLIHCDILYRMDETLTGESTVKAYMLRKYGENRSKIGSTFQISRKNLANLPNYNIFSFNDFPIDLQYKYNKSLLYSFFILFDSYYPNPDFVGYYYSFSTSELQNSVYEPLGFSSYINSNVLLPYILIAQSYNSRGSSNNSMAYNINSCEDNKEITFYSQISPRRTYNQEILVTHDLNRKHIFPNSFKYTLSCGATSVDYPDDVRQDISVILTILNSTFNFTKTNNYFNANYYIGETKTYKNYNFNIINPLDNFDFSNTVYEKNSNKFLITTTFFNDADSYSFTNGRWLLNSGDENDPRVSNHVKMKPSFGFGVHNILTNNFLRIKNIENDSYVYNEYNTPIRIASVFDTPDINPSIFRKNLGVFKYQYPIPEFYYRGFYNFDTFKLKLYSNINSEYYDVKFYIDGFTFDPT